MKDRSGKPLLSDADRALWEQISDTVKPLRRRTPPSSDAKSAEPPAGRQAAAGPVRPPAPKTRAVPPVRRPPPTKPEPFPLSGVDRRTRQKLVRGRVEIEARIDLHGFRRLDARVRLKDFLARCTARDVRWVLVITGKGASPFSRHTLHGRDYVASPERSGVLRDAVAGWLGEADFRELVSGFQPAHPKHGGGGAFYLRLRRRRPG